MITDAAVDAYIATHTKFWHMDDKRELCRRGLEAAVAAEVWAIKDAIAQARDVYAGEAMAVDCLNYLEQLVQQAAK